MYVPFVSSWNKDPRVNSYHALLYRATVLFEENPISVNVSSDQQDKRFKCHNINHFTIFRISQCLKTLQNGNYFSTHGKVLKFNNLRWNLKSENYCFLYCLEKILMLCPNISCSK